MGLGSYISAILLNNMGISPWISMIIAFVFVGLLTAVLLSPLLRPYRTVFYTGYDRFLQRPFRNLFYKLGICREADRESLSPSTMTAFSL